MRLTSPQREQLESMLVDAFSNNELARLVEFALAKDLDAIVAVQARTPRVHDLVTWTENRNLTCRLLAGAYDNNNTHPGLHTLVETAEKKWQACIEQGLTLYGGKAYLFADKEREKMHLDAVQHTYRGVSTCYVPLAGEIYRSAADGLDGAVSRKQASDAAAALNEAVSDLYAATAAKAAGSITVTEGAKQDAGGRQTQTKQIVLLGDAGAGKSTVLQRAASLLAQAAMDREKQPLPIYVPLSAWQGSLLLYIEEQLGDLGQCLYAYLRHGRAVLLIDEMESLEGERRQAAAAQITELCEDEQLSPIVIVAQRLGEYDGAHDKRSDAKVSIAPLDLETQREFLRRWIVAYGTEDRAEAALALLACGEQELAAAIRQRRTPPLLELYSTPHLIRLFVENHGSRLEVPTPNCGQLVGEYVRAALLGVNSGVGWQSQDDADVLVAAVGSFAHAFLKSGSHGATVPRAWALEQMGPGAANASALLDAAAKARLVHVQDGAVRFSSPLLRDYFASIGWRAAWEGGCNLWEYWSEDWKTKSRWDQPAVLLAGILDSDAAGGDAAEMFVRALAPINPVAAGRCIGASGMGPVEDGTATAVRDALTAMAESRQLPSAARSLAGDTLNYVKDTRRGIGCLLDSGLPDIDWRLVPAGSFLMGGALGQKPIEAETGAFAVSRYPISNAHYQAFVDGGGYEDESCDLWSGAGWAWRERHKIRGPRREGGGHDLPNHPVVWVNWYEAEAFCNWLSRELGEKVSLPSEKQWEKAARGAHGSTYPHGTEISPEDANYFDTHLNATSAVGVFPRSESRYGLMDVVGNVWEWTIDAAESGNQRAVRGGSYLSSAVGVQCASRKQQAADMASCELGFRVVKRSRAADNRSAG